MNVPGFKDPLCPIVYVTETSSVDLAAAKILGGAGNIQVSPGGDTAFLCRVVGKPLRSCLCELLKTHPRDPIEWMACWLYNYSDSTAYYEEKMSFLAEMGEEYVHVEKSAEDQKERLQLLSDAKKRLMRHLHDGSINSTIHSHWQSWPFDDEEPKNRGRKLKNSKV